MLLSGEATVTGMIPDKVRKELEGNSQLLKPKIMAKPNYFSSLGPICRNNRRTLNSNRI